MQRFNVYAIGQPVLIEAFNTDDQGDPVSPSSPQILHKPPTGPEVQLSVSEAPTGHIYHEMRATVPGKHYWRINTSNDALEGFFVVTASNFAAPLP